MIYFLHLLTWTSVFILLCAGLFVWMSAYELRDLKQKECLAKFMDCEYLCINGNDYFIPKN